MVRPGASSAATLSVVQYRRGRPTTVNPDVRPLTTYRVGCGAKFCAALGWTVADGEGPVPSHGPQGRNPGVLRPGIGLPADGRAQVPPLRQGAAKLCTAPYRVTKIALPLPPPLYCRAGNRDCRC